MQRNGGWSELAVVQDADRLDAIGAFGVSDRALFRVHGQFTRLGVADHEMRSLLVRDESAAIRSRSQLGIGSWQQ